jgi:hypothetical protein
MRYMIKVVSIDGGLPYYLGGSCSGTMPSAPVVSVSMSVVPRGEKKLRVNTALCESLTAAHVGSGLAEILAVCEVSLEICLSSFFGSCRPVAFIPLMFYSL